MHTVSETRQQAAGVALAARRGEIPKWYLKGASKEMYRSMTERELEALAAARPGRDPQKPS